MARQRSRVRQLREGDANAAYFHLIARGRKRRNFIPTLNVAGHTVADHEGMETALHDHFAAVFGTASASGMTLDFQELGIQAMDLTDLEVPFGQDEVWAAIRALPSDKAPGPDGFTGAFYKSAWPIIKPELMEAIQAFAAGDHRSLGRLNSALVALLPKKIDTSSPANFRPITMIHSFAKLI